jgi:uncharacterized protein (AIM24 family)
MQRIQASVNSATGSIWKLLCKLGGDSVFLTYVAATGEEEILLHNAWATPGSTWVAAFVDGGRVVRVEHWAG